jgi:hypothetical protein
MWGKISNKDNEKHRGEMDEIQYHEAHFDLFHGATSIWHDLKGCDNEGKKGPNLIRTEAEGRAI